MRENRLLMASARRVARFRLPNLVLAILAVSFAHPANGSTIVPKYREILTQVDISAVAPSSKRRSMMETGAGFGAQFGVALTPRVAAGFFLDYQVFASKQSTVQPWSADVGDNNWVRYSGGGFGEILLTRTRLAPFLGGYIGVQGIHISYLSTVNESDGQGRYGLGFGVASGMRYRLAQRVGATLRVQADNSPAMDVGWFLHSRLGLTLFL